jgi:hypothetical protein
VTSPARRSAPRALLGLAVAALAALAALAAGCGGGDETAAPAAPAATTTAAAAPADPREGYFAQQESGALNPPLAALNSAAVRFDKQLGPCDREAQRLFAAGQSARASIRCHLRLTTSMRDASRGVARAARGIDGDFRPECTRELRRFVASATRLQGAWQTALDNWNGYAQGDAAATARVTKSADRAQRRTRAFLVGASPVVALSKACYTAEDLAAAAARTTTD